MSSAEILQGMRHRLLKKTSRGNLETTYNCAGFFVELKTCFQIDTSCSNDTADYPANFCKSCSLAMSKAKEAAETKIPYKLVCAKCIADSIATSASTQCPCCEDAMNFVPGSVQPAPDLTQRLLCDVMVSCDTCNRDVRAGDYDSHECHRLGVIEEQCASKVIRRILSENTKDNIIQIKTGGTPLTLVRACDKGPFIQNLIQKVTNLIDENESTCVYACFEAQDTIANLHIALDRFKEKVVTLAVSQWKGYNIRVFLSGDYEFLSAMYGTSGASGKQPCLWCLVTIDDLKEIVV
eukprot:Em0001g3032a